MGTIGIVWITPIRSLTYYASLEEEDYYSRGALFRWWGQGAKQLGLSGLGDPKTLARLLQGFSPDGTQALVRNAGSAKRLCGMDFTLSVVKGFSTAWSQVEPSIRGDFDKVFNASVDETLQSIEDKALVRQGRGGAQLKPAGLIVAVFNHYSNRNLEPQAHAHCLVVNVGVAEEKTNSLLTPVFYDHIMDFSAIFRAELAARLERDLGLVVERSDDGFFEIQGVPRDLMQAFSSRRAAIREMLDAHGWTSSKAARIAALASRPPKQEVAQETLLSNWQAVGREYGFSTPEVTALLHAERPNRSIDTIKEEVYQAVAERLAHLPHFTEQELVRSIALEAPGRGLGRRDIQALAAEWLASDEVVRLSQRGRYVYALRSPVPQTTPILDPEPELEWEMTE